MAAAVILLLALLVLGVAVATFSRLRSDGEETPIVEGSGDCSSCNGDNAKCEQECMMEAAIKPIEYFDDEELDRYKGRNAANYSDEEAEEFREVIYTLQQQEVAAWCRSVTLRGIEVPNQVKDELRLLVAND